MVMMGQSSPREIDLDKARIEEVNMISNSRGKFDEQAPRGPSRPWSTTPTTSIGPPSFVWTAIRSCSERPRSRRAAADRPDRDVALGGADPLPAASGAGVELCRRRAWRPWYSGRW